MPSSQFSAGGGVVNFETSAQVAFAIFMLTGQVVLGIPSWTII